MNDLNIPLYRAKKIDSDEYVKGWLLKDTILCDIDNDLSYPFKIDPTTIAIGRKHIEDNTKTVIFFALNNEKGGDIVEFEGCKGVAKVGRYDFFINPLSRFNSKFYENDGSMRFDYDDLNIIGIQK